MYTGGRYWNEAAKLVDKVDTTGYDNTIEHDITEGPEHTQA